MVHPNQKPLRVVSQMLAAFTKEDAAVLDPFMAQKNQRQSSKKVGVDPKVASDQRGHGLGVSMDVYTTSDLEQKREAVRKLEAAVLRKPQPQTRPAESKSALRNKRITRNL